MRFAVAAAAAGLAGVAAADGGWGGNGGWSSQEGSWGSSAAPNATATSGEVWVTDVVTAFTTYCPEATQITHGGSTYTVSSATTLTITNCPCTITRPASSAWTGSWASSSESSVSPVTESSTVSTSAVWSSESSVVSPVSTSPSSSAVWTSPVSPITTSAPYPTGNTTLPATASSYSSSTSPAAATYTGAASQLSVGGGLLALLGLVAAL